MGARSNIVIQSRDERVYLYGHWMACRSIEHAAHGLRSDRYGDASFLARIVFSSMIAQSIHGDTGFGISASLTDNQFPILVIRSRHAFEVRGDSVGPGEADVWFEHEDGSRASRVYSREEFLAIADLIPPFRESWPPTEHDCGFGRFIGDERYDQTLEA